MKNKAFHSFTDTPCGRALADCEKALDRSLDEGEMADFLLDNFMTLADSDEAHQIRESVVVYFGRTSLGVYTGEVRSAVSLPNPVKPVSGHTQDAQCDVDPDTNLCRQCGAEHSEPCYLCGGRAFHQDDCTEIRSFEPAPDIDDGFQSERGGIGIALLGCIFGVAVLIGYVAMLCDGLGVL
jgi:hypothetical protein